jgi:hypothetical protein
MGGSQSHILNQVFFRNKNQYKQQILFERGWKQEKRIC